MGKLFYNILIVGAGGTGGLLANFLTKSLAGMENINIGLVDADIVEAKNLLRQPYVTEDIGLCKAEALAGALTDVYGLNVMAFDMFINNSTDIGVCFSGISTAEYGDDEIRILCGCVDNHAARKAMHDFFSETMDKDGLLYIDSGNEFSYGEVVFGAKKGGKIISPDKLYYFPDLFDGNMTPRSEESCEALNNVAPQHLCTNIMAANIMLSGILEFIQEKKYPQGIVHFDSGITGDFRMKRIPYVLRKEGGDDAETE